MSLPINAPVWAELHADAPVGSLSFYTSVALDLRVAFMQAGELADMTGASYCVLTVRWGSDPTGAPLLYRRVAVSTDLTAEQWAAHTSQHARVTFAATETGLDLGGLREARLVASWQLLDASGSVMGVVLQTALARVAGVEIAMPMSGYYTKVEADARFMRLMSESFVLSNFTRLTDLDATNPTVRELTDLMCTFITAVQNQTVVPDGEFDVSGFTERLALNGADYSAQEVKDLLCTLITDLKAKGVI